MTTTEAIALACALRPNEALDEATLANLLWELEAMLAVEIKGQTPSSLTICDLDLDIPMPFDCVYWTYLVAMIDLASKDLDSYKVSHAMFCEARDTYARWYHRTGGKE